MKLKTTKVVNAVIERDVPDHFASDESLLGKIVDVLTEEYTHKRYGSLRERLFEEDDIVVESAVRHLTNAYATANKILALVQHEENR